MLDPPGPERDGVTDPPGVPLPSRCVSATKGGAERGGGALLSLPSLNEYHATPVSSIRCIIYIKGICQCHNFLLPSIARQYFKHGPLRVSFKRSATINLPIYQNLYIHGYACKIPTGFF